MNMHEYLNKLRIISKIRPGQRLYTINNDLTVYEESIIQWIYRKWYRDSKDETTRILQDLYKSIDQEVEQLTFNLKVGFFENSSDTKKSDIVSKKKQLIITLAEKIKSSIVGIENLSKTYEQYPKTTAILEGIVQDFAIVIYKHLLEYIPVSELGKYLKGNISYNGTIIYYCSQ